MQYFYIKKGSVLPQLRLELIDDGRGTYHHFNEAIQSANVTFTMRNMDTNVVKVSKAPCVIRLKDKDTCDEEYVICYEWKQRDTNESGSFEGTFDIDFDKDVKVGDNVLSGGKLVMPIRERLLISIEE